MSATAPLFGGAGLLLGLGIGAVLRRGRYRRGDERCRPRPPAAAVPAAGLALGLVGAAAALRPAAGAGLAPAAVFSVVALVAAWVDLDVRRIPNLLTGAGTAAVLAAALVAGPWPSVLRALAGGGVLLAAFALLALVSSAGAGDAKFAAAAGAALGFEGWRTLLAGTAAGMVLAAAAAAVLLALGRSRRSQLPLAPPLAAGALLALLLR